MSNGSTGSATLGILLITASAAVFSLSGVLTKMIDSDIWTIVCWRGLIGAALITLYLLLRESSREARITLRLGWKGWLLVTIGSLSSIAFIAAFKLTYVANVAVIYATVPFFAALLEWLLRRAAVRRSVLAASALSFVGVTIMVAAELGLGGVLGNLVALLMTIGNALYMVLIRRFSDLPVVWSGALSSLQLFALGWLVTDPLALPASDVWLLLLFGAVFALAIILWIEGTRLIPAAESALLGCAEVPLAVLFAWLIIAELPPTASFLGGGLVLAAVLSHAVRDYRRAGTLKAREPAP